MDSQQAEAHQKSAMACLQRRPQHHLQQWVLRADTARHDKRSNIMSAEGCIPAAESSLPLMLGSSAGSPALLGAQRSTAMHHPDGDSAVPAPC